MSVERVCGGAQTVGMSKAAYLSVFVPFDRAAWCTEPPYREAALDREALLRLPAGRALSIECAQGCAWITIEGQSEDIVLAGGEALVLERHARVFISGLPEASVRISGR